MTTCAFLSPASPMYSDAPSAEGFPPAHGLRVEHRRNEFLKYWLLMHNRGCVVAHVAAARGSQVKPLDRGRCIYCRQTYATDAGDSNVMWGPYVLTLPRGVKVHPPCVTTCLPLKQVRMRPPERATSENPVSSKRHGALNALCESSRTTACTNDKIPTGRTRK